MDWEKKQGRYNVEGVNKSKKKRDEGKLIIRNRFDWGDNGGMTIKSG